jgi:hypothetical protein
MYNFSQRLVDFEWLSLKCEYFRIGGSNLIANKQPTLVAEPKDCDTGTKAFLLMDMIMKQFIPPPIIRNYLRKINLNVILLSSA